MVIICAKKEGVCWFPIDADGNAGMSRVKFARNYKGANINYWEGGRAGKFWGRAAIFFRVLLNGFCATEILSTAWNTMGVQVILTALHTQSWIARLKSTLISWRWAVTSRRIASNLLDFEIALETAHGFSLASLFNQRHRRVVFLYYNAPEWQTISWKPFLKRAAVKSFTDSWWYVMLTENVFFHVMTGTWSVFVF